MNHTIFDPYRDDAEDLPSQAEIDHGAIEVSSRVARVRRRRTAMGGALATTVLFAAVSLVVWASAGSDDDGQHVSTGENGPTTTQPSARDDLPTISCGAVPAESRAIGLNIHAPAALSTETGASTDPVVSFTNTGATTTSVWSTTGPELAVLDDAGGIISAPSVLAIGTSRTVGAGDTLEMPGRVPHKLCGAGSATLERGTYTVVPVVVAAAGSGEPVLVKGDASELTVR